MFTFEIGKKYFDTSACDHNCVFVIEITKRTAKTVTFLRDGKERRAKIHTDDQGEYIIPERYSMHKSVRPIISRPKFTLAGWLCAPSK